MDKKLLIDSYLEGKHPIEQEKWELPTESELDRDEALYDALLAERPSKSPLKGDFTSPLRGGRVGSWRGRGRLLGSIAAVLIAVVALFTWWNFKPQQPTQLAEKTEEPVELKDTTKVIEKDNVDKSQTKHVKLEPHRGSSPLLWRGRGRLFPRLTSRIIPCLPLPQTVSTTTSRNSKTRWATAGTAPAWLS